MILKKYKLFAPFMLALLFLVACDPNKEIYEKLDDMQVPFNKSIEYTLTDADYIAIGGIINTYKAFNDTLPAMSFIPDLLARNFRALNVGSSANITFNHLMIHPLWWDSGFGYVLTATDYAFIGVDNAFSENNPASQGIPGFLAKQFPNAVTDDTKTIIFNFDQDGDIIMNLEVYQYDGQDWILIDSREDIPYAGYEMSNEDYENFGGAIAQNKNFSSAYPPDLHLPAFLKNKFPYAIEGTEQVVKYRYFSGGINTNPIDKYIFDGMVWDKVSEIEERTEQYIYGELGWAFDPTVTFLMNRDDYMYLAVIDPIPHPTYIDFGYYYGASAFYNNFDIRLVGRRLNKNDDGTYRDPELGEVYENEGEDAAIELLYQRLINEGFIELLKYKFPNAVPQSGGIDVHFVIQFETFGDNFIRTYPEIEYRCIAAGTPPQFELVEGPRERK